MCIHGWMDEEDMVYTYTGIVFSLKKEGNSTICDNMNYPRRHYAKWNKSDAEGYSMISFIWGT